MTGFAFDPHDAEWETGSGFNTTFKTSDDWCDDCDSEIDWAANEADGACNCDGKGN